MGASGLYWQPVPAGLRDEEVQASNLLTRGGAGKAGNPKSFLLASGLVTCLILTKSPFEAWSAFFEHICLAGGNSLKGQRFRNSHRELPKNSPRVSFRIRRSRTPGILRPPELGLRERAPG